jgi:hypothetical protein
VENEPEISQKSGSLSFRACCRKLLWSMLIRMKKVGEGVVMTCLREGHDAEIQRTGHSGFFALHDLLHYSVETTLGFDEAFLGLMASGWSFTNFTRHDEPRHRPVSAQALIAEHMVGVLSLHLHDPAWEDAELLELLTEEINQDLAAAMGGCGIPAPKLAAADVATVFQTFDGLARRWAALPLGDHLELPFPPTAADVDH